MRIVPVSLTVSSLSTTTPRTAWIRSFASSTLLPLDPEMIAMAHGPRKNETDAPKRISSTFEFVPSPELFSQACTVVYPDGHLPALTRFGAHR